MSATQGRSQVALRPAGVRPDMGRHLRAGACLPNRPGMQARPWNRRLAPWGPK